MTSRAPKQWSLTKTETINTFENWRQNLQYILSLDASFAPFLIDGVNWEKKTKTNVATRGFEDDPESVTVASRRTAAQKVTHLELMLGQIANYCPIISRNSIIKNSTSIDNIWQVIRSHYGFQSTGSHFLDFSNIKLEPSERHEDLFQRLLAFIDDNLLVQNCGISHHGVEPIEDEELSSSLENLIVLTWLKLIHNELPALVKQRYGTELRTRTLASIKPEISQAMDSLLDTIRSGEDAKIMRTGTYSKPFQQRQREPYPRIQRNDNSSRNNSRKSCVYCKSCNRPSNHYLSQCNFLPESDKKFLSRARLISAIDQENEDYDDYTPEENLPTSENIPPSTVQLASSTHRVQINKSPFIHMHYHHHPVKLTLDSGAETNMIKESTAKYIGATIKRSSQTAIQADGTSPLSIKGETSLELNYDGKSYHFEALVVEDIDVEILAGVPFMYMNDITVRPAKFQVLFGDGSSYQYNHHANSVRRGPHPVRLTNSFILRAPPTSTVIWPGEYIELDIPDDFPTDVPVAIEPRLDSRISKVDPNWPSPGYMTTIARKIRIPNLTDSPKFLKKHEQFSQIHSTILPQYENSEEQILNKPDATFKSTIQNITVDPDNELATDIKAQFHQLHHEFRSVFDSTKSCYNGHLGPIEAVVNMGPVQPPQRKGRVPQYSKDKLSELQDKFDELESNGIFRKPEELNIVAEYLNPSFLIKKPSGGHRLVTSFGEVAKYAKPQPALMPDVNATLLNIGHWNHIITTDLTKAFYQIPLSKDSYKYCGVATPFRGVRVYTRCAMGMPGSETALEQLMCTVLGDLVQEGVVAKVADDLYCGGETPEDLLHTWRKVLTSLHNCNLSLSSSKTVITPKTTTILGWIWSKGTLTASPHRISTLSTCEMPTTVRGLRSFLGTYKFLARVIPNCSSILSPLEDIVAGRKSQEKLLMTDLQCDAFNKAQTFLTNNKSITLPRPSDQLWLVTDGAVKNYGLGATLYVSRNNKLHIAGFFSAKLHKRQVTWIPCEIEALCISGAIKHFSPFMIQSQHKTIVLTDSKPCVQAYEKLCRGQFSNSARVSTFLSTACRFQISITHLSGKANVLSDFSSRNAPECDNPTCQVCSFVSQMEEAVVHSITAKDLITGTSKMPFVTRSTWLTTQSESSDLRRVHAHLSSGTRPSKKATNITDIKRYLNVASIAKDKMLVVKQTDPFSPTRERIIVPRDILPGLITAIHIRLDHPTPFQMNQIMTRYFYALNLNEAIQLSSQGCHTCASLSTTPSLKEQQTTCDPPDSVGISFAADIIKQNKQLILVLRECVTSYTTTCLVPSEDHASLRDGIIHLAVGLCPLDGPFATIRVDPAPGFMKLKDDELLKLNRINLEIGRIKNKNKNPVAEKAVRELQDELLRQNPDGNLITTSLLATATARLNSRIRNQGLSSRELWTQRDQFTQQQLPLEDRKLILQQHQNRLANHPYSIKSKGGKETENPVVNVGDLVYLYSDKNKSRGRNRYLVVDRDNQWCTIRKFVGNQLRNTGYKVKTSECFTVPTDMIPTHHVIRPQSDDEEVTSTDDTEEPPMIPHEIVTPPTHHEDFEHRNTDIVSETDDRRRSSRKRNPPSRLKDYECNLFTQEKGDKGEKVITPSPIPGSHDSD